MLDNPIPNSIIIATIAITAIFCAVAVVFIKNLTKKQKEKE
ncbi:hypothetical protein [Campylobacter coli]|nr:hypothetical protein [Campylobacter coli]